MTGETSRALSRTKDELRALWAVAPGATDAPKSRACTMNLVVVAATVAQAEEWIPIVDAVVQNVPARALVVGLDPDGPERFETQVAAVCTPDARGGGGVVCSERISLVVGGASAARLPSCVDALCATDVPMTLVWLARVHAEDETFSPLARSASRIVLDTSRSSLASLSHAVRWVSALPASERPGVADLTWTRIGPWQELCARMFDPPRLQPLARRATRVSLTQAAEGGEAVGAEGALLLGWLATRLGWRASSVAGKLRFLRDGGGSVEVRLRTQSAPRAPRSSLLAVEIEASAPNLSLRGAVVRADGTDTATWSLQVAADGREEPRLEQHTRLRSSEQARLLERTLHRPPRDQALADAVVWADELRGEEFADGS